MAENIFDKWNKQSDLEGLRKDIDEAGKGQKTFKEVPVGTYEVKLVKGELKSSKVGDPMVSLQFKIVNGEFKNSLLFMNQVITKGFQIGIVNELFRSFDTELNIEFVDYKQYAELIMDVVEACEHVEFALEYGEKKGFNTFTVTEVFDVA